MYELVGDLVVRLPVMGSEEVEVMIGVLNNTPPLGGESSPSQKRRLGRLLGGLLSSYLHTSASVTVIRATYGLLISVSGTLDTISPTIKWYCLYFGIFILPLYSCYTLV